MLRKLLIVASMSLGGIASASASTLFIPGASGIPDKFNEASLSNGSNGCIVDSSTGKMRIAPDVPVFPGPHYPDCLAAFPINLPVGTTIDGVEVSYRDDFGVANRSMTAYLAVNRLKPYMGPLAVGGTSDFVVPSSQQLYSSMGSLSVPVVNGDIFWVKVQTHHLSEVAYVAVTYH
ncbi:MAG: hypothetical protein ABW186_04060 [Rhodanobacteraceae bacterium]